MNRLKEMNERRGVALKEANTLLDKARAEKRDLSKDELAALEGAQSKIDAIDANIQAEIRQAALASAAPVALSDKETREVNSFDWGRFLRGAAINRIDGVEAEMAQEGEREARAAGISGNGFVLPRLLVRRGVETRDMTATGGTSLNQGGMTIATDKAGILDSFFDRLVVRQAGATVLEGLTGNLDVPRIVAGTAPAHKAENAAADEVSPTTAVLSLSPNRLPAYVEVSNQLLVQSSSAIETVIRNNLTAQILAVAESKFFHGTGTLMPTGVAATSGIGSVAGGTNGAAPDWADIVGLETEVAVDNADIGNLHYITNQKVRGKLKTTAKVSSTDSLMIWDDRNGGLLNGYTPFTTNAVSSTLTKGTSSVASAIFFGNWSDYYIAFWSGLSVEVVKDHALAKLGQTAIHFSMYYDGGVVRPVSFAAMLDALTA